MTRILSKDNCIFCTRAKALLEMKEIEYQELKLGVDFDVSEFYEMTSGAKTFPQIWLTVDGSDIYIGGYDKLVEYFNGA